MYLGPLPHEGTKAGNIRIIYYDDVPEAIYKKIYLQDYIALILQCQQNETGQPLFSKKRNFLRGLHDWGSCSVSYLSENVSNSLWQ